MKKILLSLFLFSSFAQAQHVLSERLQSAINNSSHINQTFSIRIEMLDQVNAFEMHKEFIRAETPIHQRAVKIVTTHKENAKTSQKYLLEYLANNIPEAYQSLRKYWIVNHICLETSSEYIQQIGRRDDVAFVDLNIDKIEPLEEEEDIDNLLVSTGLIETGLEAINAPALWDLGYTGKGLLVYDYDTGVCAEHPTIKNRFLANRFPMNQSWYGHFRDYPNEINSNHGTHTLGTMIGEGLPSGDTIGVAPGAYWMACDLVTTTVAALPPLENIVAAYEWALDSDNNPETTFDIPHVINNSWRWHDDPDTLHCNDYISDLMNTLEAAGIASVFSGGNAGPSNTTISAPQRINTTIVNTFSVGSVNANTTGNPISYFSSRGPLQCPASDSSLYIHPEVVAPGHDVRSSVGMNSYSSKSGTSMAAPHVSGAVLLLKEAFPELSGADLLTALYFTSTDLGELGEDNTFGMGIINCLAAFEYLSLTNTPVDPSIPSNDLVLNKIHEPSPLIFCNTTVNPNFDVYNKGYETLDSIIFNLTLNGELLETSTWYGALEPGTTLNHSMSSFSITEVDSIENELQISALAPQWNEVDEYNNSLMQRFNLHPTVDAPFIETFESGSFETNHWRIINSDREDTWELDEAGGLDNSFTSAKMPFFVYGNLNQKDCLLSPNISIDNGEDYYLYFDYSHQHRDTGGREDSLIVEVSSDCGASYQRVFAKGGDSLTTSDTIDFNFEPIYASHWNSTNIQLNEYIAAAENVQIRFTAINGKQNNLFIDNIAIATLAEFSTLELEVEHLRLMPNPANNYIQLAWNANNKQNVEIELIDLSGRILSTKTFKNQHSLDLNWNLSDYDDGYYFFRLTSNKGSVTKGFIKN